MCCKRENTRHREYVPMDDLVPKIRTKETGSSYRGEAHTEIHSK